MQSDIWEYWGGLGGFSLLSLCLLFGLVMVLGVLFVVVDFYCVLCELSYD